MPLASHKQASLASNLNDSWVEIHAVSTSKITGHGSRSQQSLGKPRLEPAASTAKRDPLFRSPELNPRRDGREPKTAVKDGLISTPSVTPTHAYWHVIRSCVCRSFTPFFLITPEFSRRMPLASHKQASLASNLNDSWVEIHAVSTSKITGHGSRSQQSLGKPRLEPAASTAKRDPLFHGLHTGIAGGCYGSRAAAAKLACIFCNGESWSCDTVAMVSWI